MNDASVVTEIDGWNDLPELAAGHRLWHASVSRDVVCIHDTKSEEKEKEKEKHKLIKLDPNRAQSEMGQMTGRDADDVRAHRFRFIIASIIRIDRNRGRIYKQTKPNQEWQSQNLASSKWTCSRLSNWKSIDRKCPCLELRALSLLRFDYEQLIAIETTS